MHVNKELESIPTIEIENEQRKRVDRNLGRCTTCGGKWSLYMGCSDSWKESLHCSGCRKRQEICNCSR